MNSENLIRISDEFSTRAINEVNINIKEQHKRLVYNKTELLAFRDYVYHRQTLNKLSNETKTIINNLKINKPRKRGSRGGLKNQMSPARRANLQNIINVETNSKAKTRSYKCV